MRKLLAVAALAAAVTAGLVLLLVRDSGPGAGPLEGDSAVLEGQPVPVNAAYDFASIATLFVNRGQKPITIERVRLLGVAGPLEFLGTRSHRVVAGEPDKIVYGGALATESSEPSVPLSDANVVAVPTRFSENGDPDEGLQLVYRLRVPRPGIGRAEKVEVTYRSDGRRYREVFDHSIIMCAPEAEYTGSGPRKHCDEKAARNFGNRALP